MRAVRLLVGVVGIGFFPCIAFGEQSPDSLQILAAIQETVRQICIAPDRRGEYIKVEADGKGDISVEILRVLGKAGAQASARFTKEQWDGVRNVLDQTAENGRYRDCAEKLTPLFVERLFVQKSSASPRLFLIRQVWTLERKALRYFVGVDESTLQRTLVSISGVRALRDKYVGFELGCQKRSYPIRFKYPGGIFDGLLDEVIRSSYLDPKSSPDIEAFHEAIHTKPELIEFFSFIRGNNIVVVSDIDSHLETILKELQQDATDVFAGKCFINRPGITELLRLNTVSSSGFDETWYIAIRLMIDAIVDGRYTFVARITDSNEFKYEKEISQPVSFEYPGPFLFPFSESERPTRIFFQQMKKRHRL
jgi:hypothetical protein